MQYMSTLQRQMEMIAFFEAEAQSASVEFVFVFIVFFALDCEIK